MLPLTTWSEQLQPTADGSYTFFSPEFQETFHSRAGARSEALEKFVLATDLVQRAQSDRVVILDVWYGLGYNTAAALEVIWQTNPQCHVTLAGLEIDPSVPRAALEPQLAALWPDSVLTILQGLAYTGFYQSPRCEATLYWQDARSTIQTLRNQGFKADVIFLDPFSPRRCPQLWTIEFLNVVADCMAPEGKLSTYCRAAAVRSALQEVGLTLGTVPVPHPTVSHEWAQGTIATHPNTAAAHTLIPLSLAEVEHLQTRGGIPYRDPDLQATASEILGRRSLEQQTSDRESTTHWRKRWGIE